MSNQKGFAPVGVVLILVVVAIVGFGGWYVWDSNNKSAPVENSQKSDDTNQVDTERETDEKNEDKNTSTQEVDIKGLSVAGDVSQLPDYTPESFVAYLSALLSENESSSGSCSTNTYDIYSISPDRIRGGVVPTENGDASLCSGAPISWVLNSDGAWSEESIQ